MILAEFGNQRAPELPRPGHRPGHPGPDRVRRPAAQPDPGARPHAGQLDGLAGRTTPRATTATSTSARATGVESLKTYYEQQSSGRYSVDGEVTDWVKVPYNEARYGRSNGFPCASNVCSNTWDLITDALDRVGRRPAGGRAAPTRRSRPTSRRTTSGTATTTTATATSTSPTATSTTSRSSTPAATRPTATRTRARTPSGATAGTRSRTGRHDRPGVQPGRRHPDRQHRHLGRATTRSSRRTAACRCSRTSTATTSACPTTTTPPAARTTPSTGGR